MANTAQILEVSSPTVAGPVTITTGTIATILSYFASLDWGFWIGVLIGLVGLTISFLNYISNRQFQKLKDKREAEMHLLETERKRLEIKKMSGGCDAKQD
ncbi:hypothetical protein G9F32_03180 [Acinetobacter sp. 194]|uniref:hypothetical protein n=1 Tax=Acinetobacter shaoyimingii TaxID=2715164 RepID=UPI00140CBF00|nr:hypothetical protein [Acinetobacter shaoyimingii]NHB57036.1 hypothetical protein [Acinetobacter shaoyimingii]